MLSFAWTAPVTNRLLIEARTGTRRESYTFDPADDPFVNLINVTEQLGLIPGLSYRGGGIGAANQPYLDTDGLTWNTVGSVSYVTGSHSVKAGFNNLWNRRFNHWEARRAPMVEPASDYLAYRFSNGVPNQITQRATPYERVVKQPWDLGVYVQDTWTQRRLTMNAGVRFDHYSSYAPETHLGPATLVPTRDITFPKTQMLSFKDVSPRLGVTIDLFGTQKTALKIGLNKYMQALGTQVGFMNGALDPVSSLALFVTRSWNDSFFPAGDPRRGNFVPDCDLVNVLGNDECGIVSDTNFGQPTRSTVSDPRTTTGWGRRPYQWEFSASVDHELIPRVSTSFGFFRRTFGNFTVVDNLALAASDFGTFSVTAPSDPRLPDGGGYTISGFMDRNPDTLTRPASNSVQLASNYGDQSQVWSGVDWSINARMASGLTVSGGLSTGRTVTDNCDILAQVPEAGLLGVPYCRQVTDFLTDVKTAGRLHAAARRRAARRQLPEQPRAADRGELPGDQCRSAARHSAGRWPVARPTSRSISWRPGTLYGDRLNQLDLRIGKVMRAGRVKTVVSFDFYNALNGNPVLTENAAYRDTTVSGWRIPTSILPARFAKFGVQVDF